MKKLLAIALCCLMGFAQAAKVKDVEIPNTINLDGVDLKLNGAGMRVKYIFDVYVAGLYLPATASTAEAVLSMKGPKRMQLVMERDLDSDDIIEMFDKAVQDNTDKKEMPLLAKRLEDFKRIVKTGLKEDPKTGDRMSLDYIPEHGIQFTFKDKKSEFIPGDDFAQAVFKIWLGSKPADSDLKRDLLGIHTGS